jgi:hypothetical protein
MNATQTAFTRYVEMLDKHRIFELTHKCAQAEFALMKAEHELAMAKDQLKIAKEMSFSFKD